MKTLMIALAAVMLFVAPVTAGAVSTDYANTYTELDEVLERSAGNGE